MPSRLSRTPATRALLVIITVIFALEWFFGVFPRTPFGDVDLRLLAAAGGLVHDTLGRHDCWRLFAAMFLHGNLLHWAANSWTLYQLGSLYETMFGVRRF